MERTAPKNENPSQHNYLIVKSTTPTTGRVNRLYLRDGKDGRMQLYREASEGRVLGSYSKDGKGFEKALYRLDHVLPRTAVLVIEQNITWLSNNELLSRLQPVG